MQSKLATWSTENRERKFDRLLRLIADRNWLSEAARNRERHQAINPGGAGAKPWAKPLQSAPATKRIPKQDDL
jgi:hypothetical protein